MHPRHPQPGDVLAGRYRVVRTIGRGGMGLVLEAQNTVTQKRVAIKWLLADHADSPEAGERLLREATAAARVSHPNVVDVYDVLQEGEAVFLVMDLLHGEPLDALLRRGGMPMHALIGLLLQAMEGVAEAHRQDVIHRDIHPGNIFIAHEGSEPRLVPKVLDFGISKLGGVTEQRRLTRSNISMGTPLYMSYEQLYSARDVDRRTDVYSFGVILYQLLTGRRPYDGESFVEVAGKITAGSPVHPKVLRPELPGPLAELTLWAMAKNRDERMASLEQLMAELAPFAVEHSFLAEMTGERPIPVAAPARSYPALALDALERGSVHASQPASVVTPLAASRSEPPPLSRSEPPPLPRSAALVSAPVAAKRRPLRVVLGSLAIALLAAIATCAWRARREPAEALPASPAPTEVELATPPSLPAAPAPESEAPVAAQPAPSATPPTPVPAPAVSPGGQVPPRPPPHRWSPPPRPTPTPAPAAPAAPSRRAGELRLEDL